MQCPKCGHQRQDSDRQVIDGICPACGIAYDKWLARQQDAAAQTILPRAVEDASFAARLRVTLLYVPEQVNGLHFWGRCLLYMVFFVWGWSFILPGIDWQRIGGSFLHSANLPFHEFGHVLFSPFGRFLTILGGSLFQVLLPLGLMLAFMLQRHDNFAASVMLWWSGQNFIDIAPYIADAEYRGIPLIRGMSEEYHDWGNLLTMLDAVDQAAAVSRVSFSIGVLLMLASFAWGAAVLYRQYQVIDD